MENLKRSLRHIIAYYKYAIIRFLNLIIRIIKKILPINHLDYFSSSNINIDINI